MGYYVTLQSSTFGIPNKNLAEAYERMCALNEREDLKTGGSWRNNVKIASWFGFLDPDYPETCPDAETIFEELGFDTEHNDRGLFLLEFDNKWVSQQLFIDTVADLAFPDSRMEWLGEDGERWEWTPEYGTRRGTITYGTPEPELRVQDAPVEPETPQVQPEALLRIAKRSYEAGYAHGLAATRTCRHCQDAVRS